MFRIHNHIYPRISSKMSPIVLAPAAAGHQQPPTTCRRGDDLPHSLEEKLAQFERPHAWLWLLVWWILGAAAFHFGDFHGHISRTTFHANPIVREAFRSGVVVTLPVAVLCSLVVAYAERRCANDHGKPLSVASVLLSGVLTGPATAFVQLSIFEVGARAVHRFVGRATPLSELMAGMVTVNLVESQLRQSLFQDRIYAADFSDVRRVGDSVWPGLSVALSVAWTALVLFMYNVQGNALAVVAANMVNEACWAFVARLQFPVNEGPLEDAAPAPRRSRRRRDKAD